MLKATLQPWKGVPAIFVNGLRQEAHMLYLNTPAQGDGDERARFLRQARYAAESGVHIFTFHCTMDPDLVSPPEETNVYLRSVMHDLVEADPEALLFPRCSFNTSLEACATPSEEAVRFTDGRGMESDKSSFEEYSADPNCFRQEGDKAPFADFVSDYWRHQAMLVLTRFIRACRADPVLRDHMIGYHFASGMTSEHYQFRYWDGVLDVSEANQKGFRYWLWRKYRTDEALSTAWEQPVTIRGARVPEDLPGIRKQFRPEIRERARYDRRTFDLMEWYTWRSWDADLDFPDAMQYSLRVWLQRYYYTDEALSAAWGGEYHIADDLCPPDFKTTWLVDSGYDALLCRTGWKRFSDYLDYYGDQVAALIEEAAATVKRETAGDGLTCFFYGYHYDVQSAQSGHHSLERLLKCPDVDILCAPLSYYNRNEGGMGASMADVSSIHAAGKLWLDESDYRQPVVTGHPKYLDVCKSIRSLAGAREIAVRQCGKLALWGSANWWMDLRGLGWYDSRELWSYIAEGRRYQREMEDARIERAADVIFLDDEKAMSHIGDAWGFADDLMNKSRNEAYFTGLSCDWRTLEDFIDGRADGAKLYVFLNPFRILRDGKDAAVLDRLCRLQSAAVWMYGFGPEDDPAALKTLTGFDLVRKRAPSPTVEIGGETYTRRAGETAVVPENGMILGTYASGDPAFAFSVTAGYPSYFLGGSRAYGGVLRQIASRHGARLYTPGGDVFLRLGNLAVLHTASAGEKTVDFGVPGRELRSGAVFRDVFTVDAPAATTYLFITD